MIPASPLVHIPTYLLQHGCYIHRFQERHLGAHQDIFPSTLRPEVCNSRPILPRLQDATCPGILCATGISSVLSRRGRRSIGVKLHTSGLDQKMYETLRRAVLGSIKSYHSLLDHIKLLFRLILHDYFTPHLGRRTCVLPDVSLCY